MVTVAHVGVGVQPYIQGVSCVHELMRNSFSRGSLSHSGGVVGILIKIGHLRNI